MLRHHRRKPQRGNHLGCKICGVKNPWFQFLDAWGAGADSVSGFLHLLFRLKGDRLKGDRLKGFRLKAEGG
jgi:hypothetical protein